MILANLPVRPQSPIPYDKFSNNCLLFYKIFSMMENWNLTGSLDEMPFNVFVGNGFIRSGTSITIRGSLDGKGFLFSTFFHPTYTP